MRLRNILRHLRTDRNISLSVLHQKYTYEPLPSPTCVRLLEVLPSIHSKVVRCSLQTYELLDAPPFRALSYTWGRSDIDLRSVSKDVVSTLAHDHVDTLSSTGHVGAVPRHSIICDGRLLKVTSNLRDALRMLGNTHQSEAASRSPSYYWIDALCMDQNNISERNAQVARMADVFAKAKSIIVWLGKEDEFTMDAIRTMSTIAAIPEEEWPHVPYTSFYNPESADSTKVSRLSFYNWLGFIVLINRPWFKRAWVVQEIALASSARVICGKVSFDWDMLSKTLSFIKATKWYHHLHTEKLKSVKTLRRHPGIYKRVLQSKLSVGIGPVYLNETRLAVTKSSEARSTGNARPPPLPMLLDKHRFAKSTDPRDKVYAFLGLADRTMYPFRTQPGALKPNYNLTVQEVYAETARVLITAYRNLALLSHVEDPSVRNIQGLPSWVPDLSVPLDPYPLRFRGPSYWTAAGNLPWQPDTSRMQQGLLDTRGRFLDYIDGTSVLSSESVDPSASWASMVRLALSLNLPYPILSNKDKTPLSRLELLWRVLTTDVYAHTHPAPSFVGSLFLDYILNLQIRYRLMPWSGKDAFQPHHSPLSDSIYPEWQTLLSLEPPGSPCSVKKYKQRMTCIVESMFNGTYSPIELAQLQHEVDQSGGQKRRLFKTRAGYLGTGPRSLREGDEVWILNRGGLPYVLRPQVNGHYHLVGESFVYGVMHGEALELPLQRSNVTIE